MEEKGEERREDTDAGGSGKRGGGWEDSERGGEAERQRGGESAGDGKAARRAAGTGLEATAGVRAGGCRETAAARGLSDARLPLAHPARTVFPLAKPQRLYRSLSDPPNWLLMTP